MVFILLNDNSAIILHNHNTSFIYQIILDFISGVINVLYNSDYSIYITIAKYFCMKLKII